MSIELSVIIPTYKRTDSLKKLLTILLKQENADIEIIVVDQNSDNYFDDAIVKLLSRINWVRLQKPNASDARNTGFLCSKAPYVLFIDDDLIPENDFCHKGLSIFRNYPGINCFVPLVYNDQGYELAINDAKRKYLESWPDNNDIFSITDSISAAVFFKREIFSQSGGFDKYFFEFAKTAEDQEFFLRMLTKGLTLWFVPSVKVFHDEKIPGGCDLRTEDYWVTREKCMKAWTLRYRIRNINGKISIRDFIRLLRSSVLNREVLSSPPIYMIRQMALMKKAVSQSYDYFKEKQDEYAPRIKRGFLN